AYQILVSSSEKNARKGDSDIWNSGKIASDSSNNILFAGKKLESYNELYWRVKIWTNQGDSAFSEVNYWKMTMLDASEWSAKWIGLDTFSKTDAPYRQQTRLAARYLRKEAEISKDIRNATAYISGLGLYQLYINEKKIGDEVLTPGPTDYNNDVPYNTYDVTQILKKGANGIGVILGNGRFFNMRDFRGKPDPITQMSHINYGFPRMAMQIRLEYTDGSIGYISSDASWKVTDEGPIRANNEYDGEEYDARKELYGWTKPGYDDVKWTAASLVAPPRGKLFSQLNENIRIKETLSPKNIYKTNKGTYMLDMGQNMVGWIRMRVRAKAGDTIRMVLAERLKNKDTLYIANLREAKVTDTYVAKGKGLEIWQPSFTYHGFQYVEVSGLSTQPSATDFEGQVVYDDVPTIGQFHTSNATINQIYNNAYWSIRGNYRGIPTDCPQRDERVAWLGDRLMSSYGESFIFDNSRLYAKWMADARSAQKENGSLPNIIPAYWINDTDNVTYPSAFIIIPEMLRKQFGDENTYRNYYPEMKKWVLYMWNTYKQEDLVLRDSYGDWCVAPEEGTNTIWTNDPKRTTDVDCWHPPITTTALP
ncbi:MAG: alpha-rhamnosidase, partial [Pedobacter sp.]